MHSMNFVASRTFSVFSYPGCQRFFAARFVTCRPKAARCRPRPTNERRSREKTSGEERFDLLFSLNFDHSYHITFKSITANISYCDHMHQHVKIRQIWVFNYKRYFNVSNGGICWWLSQEFFLKIKQLTWNGSQLEAFAVLPFTCSICGL